MEEPGPDGDLQHCEGKWVAPAQTHVVQSPLPHLA